MHRLRVVTLPQSGSHRPRKLVLQETLREILESQKLVDEAKAQVLKELEAGADIEVGKYRARTKKSEKDGKIIRELKVWLIP